MIMLSAHFSLAEMIRSSYAETRGYANVPSTNQALNLKYLAQEILEPIRRTAKAPLIILSGYRAPLINAGVNGSPTSQHMDGEAADFVPAGQSTEWLAREITLMNGLPFDQLIWRRPRSKEDFIHISGTRLKFGRREVMTKFDDVTVSGLDGRKI